MNHEIPEHERLGDALDAWTCALLMRGALTLTEFSESLRRNRAEVLNYAATVVAPNLWRAA